MRYLSEPSVASWGQLIARPTMSLDEIEPLVRPIMQDVRQNGDQALIRYAALFDKTELSALLATEAEFDEAEQTLPSDLKTAIQTAFRNIRTFHSVQKEPVRVVETMPGVTCWRKSVPIEKVGLYIPGGTAPLFSSVLMLAAPAQVAGCPEVVMCTPPNRQGGVHPAMLYAARLAGVSRVIKAGGAQAIAAMTYGTESVPAVYKIFGPGNQYVTAAKQLAVREGVAIDLPAGPSEVAILADYTANPAFIAADLLSQAEHGADSQVLLVTTSAQLYEKVQQELTRQLAALPRKEMAEKALQNSLTVYFTQMETAVAFINAYAAEHLIIATSQAEAVAEQITQAGSVFIGHFTPESVGDYASGTNHTLPTGAFARNYSGVSLDSFFKKITYQQLSPEGLELLGPVVERMAEAEELEAHRQAVAIRRAFLKQS